MIASINQTEHGREIEEQQSRRYRPVFADQIGKPSRVMRVSRQAIADHPVAALAVAAVVGLTAGLLVKRR